MAELSRDVVLVDRPSPGVVQITMRDTEHRNTFSPALIEGLDRSFAAIEEDESCRAVVITGYDTYFASGGTQEMLVKMARGEVRFNQVDFFRLALDCSVPVVAAMQGHGLGGGFVFGLYADFTVFARESIYTANFMKYGFTPGMGATVMTPARLGPVLAQEMMFTARNYRGDELAQRGCAQPVVPRREVLPYALRLASNLAEKPRHSLQLLKRHLTSTLREDLDAAIRAEVDMHDQTFGRPEVMANIESRFGGR